MHTKTFLKGNRQIAILMGHDYKTCESSDSFLFHIDGSWVPDHMLNYHTSWDALMPAVERMQTSYRYLCDFSALEYDLFGCSCKLFLFGNRETWIRYYWETNDAFTESLLEEKEAVEKDGGKYHNRFRKVASSRIEATFLSVVKFVNHLKYNPTYCLPPYPTMGKEVKSALTEH